MPIMLSPCDLDRYTIFAALVAGFAPDAGSVLLATELLGGPGGNKAGGLSTADVPFSSCWLRLAVRERPEPDTSLAGLRSGSALSTSGEA
jgi:hypothetical protein